MKIFRFFLHTSADGDLQNNDITVKVLPDTAMLIQKRPFFIPDFTQECKVQLCYAVRINRLGRSIHAKFANRYYTANEIMLGAHFVARDLLEKLKKECKPYDIAVGFDNAVVLSESYNEDLSDKPKARIEIDSNLYQYPFDLNLYALVDQLIAEISEFYTLKQGDILLIPVSPEEHQVEIDNRVSLCLNDKKLTSFNVK